MIECTDSLYCDEKEKFLIGGAGSLYIPTHDRETWGRETQAARITKGPGGLHTDARQQQ